MAYVAKNLAMFTAAYTAAFAGMNISSRPYLPQTAPSYYATLALVAGAFAQQFDTTWGTRGTTNLQLQQAESAIEAIWEVTPPPTEDDVRFTPTHYTGIVNSIIALMDQADAYYVAQAIPAPAAADPTALQVGYWFINAGGNPNYPIVGDDDNDGLSVATPLFSWAALEARLGVGHPLLPGVPSAIIAPIRIIAVNFLSDLPASDQVDIHVTTPANCILVLLGNNITVRTGFLSTSTQKVRATNTKPAVADGVLFTAADIDLRLRITGGVNVGQFTWVTKDLGANTFRVLSWSTPTMPGASPGVPDVLIQTGLVSGTALVGDPYVLERNTKITLRQSSVITTDGGTGTSITLGFANLDFQPTGPGLQGINISLGNAFANFKGCKFSGGANIFAFRRPQFLGCYAVNSITAVNALSPIFWRGGGCRGPFVMRNYGVSAIDDDAMVQGAGAAGGFVSQVNGVQLGTVWALDTTDGFRFSSNGGSAVAPVNMTIAGGSGAHQLAGDGNTGRGALLLGGSNLSIESTQPVVVGAGLDYVMGAGAVSFFYDPATGVQGGPIANSWANLFAAQPAGCGGSGHNPDRNCHIVRRG